MVLRPGEELEMSTIHAHPAFKKGDRVKIALGQRKLTGEIVEDRGALGAHGRHLFRVHVFMEPYEPMMLELPEDEMERFPVEAEPQPSIEKRKAIEYMINGGLISILRSNIAGGRNQPRVWLCLDQLGNVTHTFIPERGVVGGEVVPFSAVHDDRVFTPKRKCVTSFIEKSFKLTPQEAQRVINEIGVAP